MRRRPRPVRAAVVLACGFLAIPAAAGAAVPQLEQVNRESGAAGAFGLISAPLLPGVGAITSDGRYSAFSLAPDGISPPSDEQFTKPGLGLFVRDIVTNTTTRLTSKPAFITGLDGTERAFSFITRERLDPADTNDAPDLYAYERTTGAKVLISRADGYRGAALGITSEGTVLRGTRYAIFGTSAGVIRRDLLLGKNTRISGGDYVTPITDDPFSFALSTPALSDEHASADGKVVATSEGIVTPARVLPLPAGQFGGVVKPLIASSGATAVWQTDQTPGSLRLQNTATGAITTPVVPAAFAGRIGVYLQRLSPDGKSALAASFDFNGFVPHLDEWNLTTGTLKPYTLPFGSLSSRNGKYAITAGAGGNPVVTALAAKGSTLPGTVEVPSANAYVDLRDECIDDENGPGRAVVATTRVSEFLPPSKTVRIRVTRPSGQLVIDRTLTTPSNPQDDFPYVALPVGTGAYRTEVTVRLVDGRTASERSERPALPAGHSCLTY